MIERTLGLVVPMFNEETRLVDYGKRLLDFIARAADRE